MAYVKVADRNLKMIKVFFISKDIKITKMVREDRVWNFRQNILAKNNLLFKKYPTWLVSSTKIWSKSKQSKPQHFLKRYLLRLHNTHKVE